ncbi:MAG: hypothetical protein HYZ11_09995 [Candidatus Tectomicrobia bacterium]|uniref:Uncharacterized protein n=1 Tax=Tectimicrobiota bacterium TaxID=2528274 RepID=A0A932I2A6_UNCTE|nr:hypothetical protein [Candidatus Tectomicrobia bacterium]
MRKPLTAISLMALILSPAAAGAVEPFWGGDPVVAGCRTKINQARNRSTAVGYPMRDNVAELISRAVREERAGDFIACHGFAEVALMQIDRSERGEPQARIP